MVKNSRETIKQDELKVLTALEQNSQESIDAIAKNCGFSRQKVWRIIKQLESQKTIWGYTAVTDENAKNLKHFIALLKRSNVPFDDAIRKEMIEDKIDHYTPGLVTIENIYHTHGVADMVFTFYATDIIAAKKFVEKTANRYHQYVEEYFLIETLVPIRKQGLKNPNVKELTKYL